MNEEKGCPSMLKSLWQQIGAPVVVALLIALGSGVFSVYTALVRLDNQLSKMKDKTEAHEQRVERDIASQKLSIADILRKVEENTRIIGDHEKRIVRLEAQTTVLQTMLEEVRTDVKAIIKAMSIK